jgi:hypothetical protein
MDNTYFDIIDNSHKAYWLGFLWCDGYVWERHRYNNAIEYGIKLDLVSSDYELLTILKSDIGIHTSIKTYVPKASYKTTNNICRCSYYNKHLVITLMDKYGIIPHRTDISKLLNHIPKEFEKDFIRGCLDADGSFSFYHCIDNGYDVFKATIAFGGTEQLLNFIWNHLSQNNLTSSQQRPKINQRHENRDGNFRDMRLCGKQQVRKILSYLYDNADIYLPRKYYKYQQMKEEF